MEKQENRRKRETLVNNVVNQVIYGKFDASIFEQLEALTDYVIYCTMEEENFNQVIPLFKDCDFEDASCIHLKVYTSLSKEIKKERISFQVMYRIYTAMKYLRPYQRISNSKSFELSICKSLYEVDSHKDLCATLEAMHLIDIYTWEKRTP